MPPSPAPRGYVAALCRSCHVLCHDIMTWVSPPYSLSTLSQKSSKVRQSPNLAVVSPFSATVSLFCDSVDRALDYSECRYGSR